MRAAHKPTPEQRLFLSAFRAALHGEQIPPQDGELLCGALTIAVQQGLLPVVLEAVPEAHDPQRESEAIEAFRKHAVGQVLRQAARDLDCRAIYRCLRQHGMQPVVFKGVLCSRLYPMKFHRISGDCDLYFPPEEQPAARRLLEECGLRCQSHDELYYEQSYRDPEERVNIEFHRTLFEAGVVAIDDMNGFFADFTDRTAEIDGWLSMSPHDHMLYLILHAFRHFVGNGVGLRQTCDVGLWAQTYGGDIDWEKLLTQCASVRADKFAAALFRISEQYLGMTLPLPDAWRDIAPNPDAMLADMLAGGVFGFQHAYSMFGTSLTMNAVKRDHSGRLSGVWQNLFPPYRFMVERYPYLGHHPILLPFAWCRRISGYVRRWLTEDNVSAVKGIQLSRARLKLLKQYDIIK